MLPVDVLISPTFSSDSLLVAGVDKRFSYYIHSTAGPIDVALGTYNYQVINALEPSIDLINHANLQFERISSRVNVGFDQVFSSHSADISFYVDSEIDLGDPSVDVFGLTLTNYDPVLDRRWFEVFLNGPSIFNFHTSILPYVFNHELLHVLGLEHTFDDSDGDFYLSTDPLLSATPEQTVMSYRSPLGSIYPDDLTSSDYSALIEIWGFSQESIEKNHNKLSVHRLLDSITGRHLFTSSDQELDILIGEHSTSSFIYEGVAYEVNNNADVDLYRFFNVLTGNHIYSSSVHERNLLINLDSSPYIYEGVAFKVFSSDSAPIQAIPISRFYDSTSDTHFYSANPHELSIWRSSHPEWIDEGIAWYA